MCVENIIYIYILYIWYVDCILLYTVWYEYALHFVIVQWFVAHTITCIHPAILPSVHPSVHPSIHPPALTLQSTTLQSTTLLHVTLHYITLHYIALHYIALQYLVNFTTSYYITFHDIALHVIWHYPHTHRLCIYVRTYIYIYIQQRRNRTTISVCGRWLNAAWPGWRKIGRVRSVPRSASPNRVTYWKNTQLLIHLSLETTALRLVQSYDLRLLTSLLSDSVIERSEAHIYIYIRII